MKSLKKILTFCVLALLLTACGTNAASQNTEQIAGAMTWQEQYDLGMRYLAEGNYEEAIIAFTAAIEIDPKQAEAYVGRGDAYVMLAETIDEEEKGEQYQKAAQDYSKALELETSDPSVAKKAAAVYFQIGEAERGAELIERRQEAAGTVTHEPFLTSIGTELYDYPDNAYGFIHGQAADVDLDGRTEYVSLYYTRKGFEVHITGAEGGNTLYERTVGTVGGLDYCTACDVMLFYSRPLHTWCIAVESVPVGAYTGVDGVEAFLYRLKTDCLEQQKAWDWNTFVWTDSDFKITEDAVWAQMKATGWPACRYYRMPEEAAANRSGNYGAAWLARTDIDLTDGAFPVEYTRYMRFADAAELAELTRAFGPFEVFPPQSGTEAAQPAFLGDNGALSEIAYLGDWPACRMSREAALAYAGVVRAWPKENEWFGPAGAALVDAGGDGYPLLLVGNSYYDYDIDRLVGCANLYEYADTAMPVKAPRSYALGTLNGKPAILAYDEMTGALDYPYRYSLMTVSSGKTALAHEIVVKDGNTIVVDGANRSGQNVFASLEAWLASFGWAEQQHIGPDGDIDEINISYSAPTQFIAALLAYVGADSDEIIPAKGLQEQNRNERNGNDSGLPVGSPLAYIGKTLGEISQMLGCAYQTDWFEGPIAFFDSLPGVWLAGNWYYVNPGDKDDDGVVTDVIVSCNAELYGGLHGYMSYPELVAALSGNMSLQEPEWGELFGYYYVGFEYGGYDFTYHWESLSDAKPVMVWISKR